MRAKIIMIIITVRDCNMHACKYVQLKGTEALMEGGGVVARTNTILS